MTACDDVPPCPAPLINKTHGGQTESAAPVRTFITGSGALLLVPAAAFIHSSWFFYWGRGGVVAAGEMAAPPSVLFWEVTSHRAAADSADSPNTRLISQTLSWLERSGRVGVGAGAGAGA